MVHQELSGEIIGAAMNVPDELKPGLDAKLCENALVIELKARQAAGPTFDRKRRAGERARMIARIRAIRVIRGSTNYQ